MKNRVRMTALFLGAALCVCACTKTPTNEGDPLHTTVNTTNGNKNENQSKLDVLRPAAYANVEGLNLEPGSYISMIGRSADDSYWKEVEAGAKQAVADINSMLGYKGDNRIRLTYSAPDTADDVEEQINILDEELDRYPAAICIAPIDMTACHSQFELAADNGIPIVTFDSGTSYAKIAAHVSTDNLEAARTAAIKTAGLIDESGEVAVFIPDSLSTTAKDRETGFTDALAADYPNIQLTGVYHLDQLDPTAQEMAAEQNASLADPESPVDPASFSQKDIVKYILEKHPNLKAVYTASADTTQLVAGVIDDLKKTDLHLVGFDGGKEQLKLLSKDAADGIILQNPYGIGYASVIAAARAVLGLGNEAFIDSGYTWVTKKTMDSEDVKKIVY